MFNKEESNKIKRVQINKKNLKRIGYLFVTTSLIVALSQVKEKEYDDKLIQSHINYEKGKIEYLQRVNRYGEEREYDSRIAYLYENGKIMIDGNVYHLGKFYITYNSKDENHNYHLMCVTSEDTDILLGTKENYSYDAVIKFMNTTAFINMINSDNVVIDDDVINIKNKDKIKEMIDNWDGMIHSEVKETDAITNKNRFGR